MYRLSSIDVYKVKNMCSIVSLAAYLLLLLSLSPSPSAGLKIRHPLSYHINSATSSCRRSFALNALKENAYQRLEAFKAEYKKLESQQSDSDTPAVTDDKVGERLKELSVILQCFDALEQIDKDLLLMRDQLDSDDESLRESAKVFLKEFNTCKEEIEGVLNDTI